MEEVIDGCCLLFPCVARQGAAELLNLCDGSLVPGTKALHSKWQEHDSLVVAGLPRFVHFQTINWMCVKLCGIENFLTGRDFKTEEVVTCNIILFAISSIVQIIVGDIFPHPIREAQSNFQTSILLLVWARRTRCGGEAAAAARLARGSHAGSAHTAKSRS